MQLGEVFDRANPRLQQDDMRMQLIAAQADAARANERLAKMGTARDRVLRSSQRLLREKEQVKAILDDGSKADGVKLAEIKAVLFP